MNKIVHVISHTHWDREWYLPYEKHHIRLVKLMDDLLEVLERDSEFQSFHLDGQTIILDDYLEIHPERRSRIIRHVIDGRLRIGPWYILQDEFLTSSEANIRNLLIGHRDAIRYGGVTKIGYFPDSFGNIGQAPQILSQAGIRTAVFGRGVKPTGFNNSVADAEHYESPFSEMIWQSPDGSEVLGILFANWYHNGMEIPSDPEKAKAFWQTKIADAERYASTCHLLLMNGCDHQPVQTDISDALSSARNLFPDYAFIHSNFPEYAQTLSRTLRQDLAVVKGELRSQRTDGWGTLVNTASARVYIKQENQKCQTLLEKVAEPLATLAGTHGVPYPHNLFGYAWKTLMQNHPHDSICGCSVDEVHREMMTRFAKSLHMTEALVEESSRSVVSAVDTSVYAAYRGARPFVVFNTSGRSRSGTLSVELEVGRFLLQDGSSECKAALAELAVDGQVINAKGEPIDCKMEDLGVRFGYELPDDRFRQPYWARVIRIHLHVADIPALGYATYAWVPVKTESGPPETSLLTGAGTMENEHLRVSVAGNGTLTLLDKSSGRSYSGLCEYEDAGDVGNEYMFRQPDGDKPLTTKSLEADVQVVEDSPFRAILEITHEWEIPGAAEALLAKEMEAFVPFTDRTAQRGTEKVPLVLRTRVMLEKDARLVKIAVSFDNQARDHRLRVLIPTDIHAGVHYADSIFELAERPNAPAPEWKNPSNCQHQQAFVAVDNDKEGLMVANCGLNEYEVLRDGRNTIAVTLLRAVGELGDWGVFPTPEAQCLGTHIMELALIPYHGSNDRCEAATLAYQFQVPWTARQTDVHAGTIPPRYALLGWEGSGLALTAAKVSEQTEDVILRWYNMSSAETRLVIAMPAGDPAAHWYKSNVLEEMLDDRLEPVGADGRVEIGVRPFEILTLGYRANKK